MFNIEFNTSIDIWSLGCIAYEMLFQKPLFPFPSEKTIMKNIFEKIGFPITQDYIKSKYYQKYLDYRTDSYIDTNLYPDNNLLETHLSIKISRKFKDIDFNMRNKFIDFIINIIVFDINRKSAEELLEMELFN